jgi:hypothetical protein
MTENKNKNEILLPTQKFAYRVLAKRSPELSEKSKLELLGFISNNVDALNTVGSLKYHLFDLYLNNNILSPSNYVTATFLATHFRLITNSTLCKFIEGAAHITLDVFPIEVETERWNFDYVMSIITALDTIKSSSYKLHLRICDAFNNNGRVSWFDPFTEKKEMSVEWAQGSYTVRDFETTYRMCNMGKRAFSDYVTPPPAITHK